MIPFRLVNGRRIDLENPRPEDVDVRVIACGLSKICRFTGQLRQFYSVAEHATNVAAHVHPELRFAALHHDDSEAYLNDLSRHMKHSGFLKGYRILEEMWTDLLDEVHKIELDEIDAYQLKLADDVVAIFERQVLQLNERWHPETDIPNAVESGFIARCSDRRVYMLIDTARRGPWDTFQLPYVPLTCQQAETLFLNKHDQYQRLRTYGAEVSQDMGLIP